MKQICEFIQDLRIRRVGLCLLALPTVVVLVLGGSAVVRTRESENARNLKPPLDALLRDLQAQRPIYYDWAEKPPISPLLPKAWLRRAHMAMTSTNSQRTMAVWKLKQMGTNAWPAVPSLVKALDSRDPSVSVMAASALAAITADESPDWQSVEPTLNGNHRAATAFRYIIVGSDPLSYKPYAAPHRRFALLGLAATRNAGSVATREIAGVLRFEEAAELRASAVLATAAIEQDASRVISVLMPFLTNRNEWPQVGAASVRALALRAPDAPETIGLVRQAAEDPRALVRIESARSLWRLHQPKGEVLAILTPLLSHKLASVRRAALNALADMGTAARASLPSIQHLATDPNDGVRRACAAAVKSIHCLSEEQGQRDHHNSHAPEGASSHTPVNKRGLDTHRPVPVQLISSKALGSSNVQLIKRTVERVFAPQWPPATRA